MKSEQNANKLTIREKPGCLWIFGLFFIAIGAIFVYGSLGGFTNHVEVPTYALYLSFFLGAVAVSVGFWVILRAPVTKLLINRLTQTVTLTKIGVNGKKETVYTFEEIKQFRLIEGKDSDGDSIWSLGMELSTGETIKISSLESHVEKFKRDFAFEANQFLDKQLPYQNVLNLSDESSKKIG